MKAVLSLARLSRGSRVLDIGCGQGFFSDLFARCGMHVTALDVSETGVRAAQQTYKRRGIEFVVGDITTIRFDKMFDCAFARSLSLYNSDDFSRNREVTDTIMRQVRKGGIFIFEYNTKLSSADSDNNWRYHTLGEAREHFLPYTDARCFFTLRVEAIILGKYAFNPVFSAVGAMLSSAFNIGGEIVCILKKE